MKTLLLSILLCILTAATFAQDSSAGYITTELWLHDGKIVSRWWDAPLPQDRTPPLRRQFQPSPQLVTYPDTDNAAGIAQTPHGYALSLSGPVPAGSIVGIYGYRLVSSSASKILLWSDTGVMVVDCDAWRYAFFEMVTFRLPANLYGDVWVTTLGRQTSNTVRITIE